MLDTVPEIKAPMQAINVFPETGVLLNDTLIVEPLDAVPLALP
jgi:hypothetical protein